MIITFSRALAWEKVAEGRMRALYPSVSGAQR